MSLCRWLMLQGKLLLEQVLQLLLTEQVVDPE